MLCPQSKLQELPCPITRACSGPTVWEKPWWSGDEAPNCFYRTKDPWRHIWQQFPRCQWSAKGTSLSKLVSGVLGAASSVPWSGGPAGEGRTSWSRDPRRGGEPLSSATFPGERDWEKSSLETAAPWNIGRVGRPISCFFFCNIKQQN